MGSEQQRSASVIRDVATSRRHYDLAWDSFKLAVNYYMKAETLAEVKGVGTIRRKP